MYSMDWECSPTSSVHQETYVDSEIPTLEPSRLPLSWGSSHPVHSGVFCIDFSTCFPPGIHTPRELTYPTLGKEKSSSKVPLGWDMLVPWRVYTQIHILQTEFTMSSGRRKNPSNSGDLFLLQGIGFMSGS